MKIKHANTLAGTCPQAETSGEDSAIDEMVYELYGLTEDEVRIVEGKG